MTPTRYFIARVGQAFGIHRRNKRLAEGAFELHLLREAEEVLGREVWDQVEDIDELSVEYWTLRKLTREREELTLQLQNAEESLNNAHSERVTILNGTTDAQRHTLQRREEIIEEIEHASFRRDEVVAQGREIRRQYDGQKLKIEVLQVQGAPHEVNGHIDGARKQMATLKEEFTHLRMQREQIARELTELEQSLGKLDQEVELHRKRRREEADHTFVIIGNANRDISASRAELGLIETRERQLFGEIGRFVSRHSPTNAKAARSVRNHRGLVEIMAALRTSIQLNYRLGGQA